MKITKNLILFLLSILKVNGTNPSTDMTSIFSSFSISNSNGDDSLSQKFLDKKPKNIPLAIRMISYNDPDPDRVKVIHESLDEICNDNPTNSNGKFPKELGQIIGRYERLVPLEIAYEKIRIKLDPFNEKQKELNPSNKDFLNNLDLIVKGKKDEYHKDDIFWKDLKDFLSLNILYLKQNMINDSNLEEVSKTIRSFNSTMNEKEISIIPLNFSLKNMKIRDFDFDSLYSEFQEQSHRLSLCFIKALKYFYSSPKADKEGSREVTKKPTCKEFKSKFFDNGDPNTDVILQSFMFKYDCKRGTIRSCLEFDIDPSHSEIDSQSKTEYFTIIPEVNHKDISVLNFILANKSKFLIRNDSDLYWLLIGMKDAELLERENIKAIIEFEKNPIQFDLKLFESYLREHGKRHSNPRVLNFINECLGLFKLEPLKKVLSKSS